MITYIKGGYEVAIDFAKKWSKQTGREVVKVKKGWHDSHPLDSNDKCYIVGPGVKLIKCNQCFVFAHGHKAPKGMKYLTLDKKGRELTFQDFLKHYDSLGDKYRDSVYAVLMKDRLPKRIVASYLYTKYQLKEN